MTLRISKYIGSMTDSRRFSEESVMRENQEGPLH